MGMDTAHTILRSARAFFAGTMFSRFSGLLREIAMAISFGASPQIAAFMVSFRLSNLFRRLLGEGNLQAGFVPHFAALKEEGAHFYRDAFYSMGLVLVALVGVLEGVLWGCRQVVGEGWGEIVDLTMWMTPGLFFICLYSLNSALLQCQKRYFLPAAAPVVFNAIWIGTVLLYPSVEVLAMAITLAYAGQWLITSFEGLSYLKGTPRLFSPDCRALLKPLALGIVGVGAVQFNSSIDALFARMADLRGPAFLWYAIRIQQLPLALFGVAFSGALLPPLSRTQDPEHRRHLLHTALQTSAALMIVCTFALVALGGAGVNLLFGHGDFTPDDVQETLHCLWAYGMGLVPSVFVMLLSARYYAEKNYHLPSVASVASVVSNIVLNTLFVFGLGWGAVSIAIATSLSSIVNALLLSRGAAFDRSFWIFFGKMVIAAAVPAALVLKIQAVWFPAYSRLFSQQLFELGLLSALYLLGLGAMAWLLRARPFFSLFRREKQPLSDRVKSL
jgi:putative peptidoglycan lipid II flippase